MKKLITFLSFVITVAMLALPVAARDLVAQPAGDDQDQCAQETRDKLYKSFLDNRQKDQAKAYDDAKKYLACPATEVTEDQQKIIDYLKRWSTAYEDAMRKIRFTQLLYSENKYQEAYALGKEILAKEPDNLKVMVDMGANGYLVTTVNGALKAEALDYARRALQQLEAGKTVEDWQPLAGRDVAVAYLNYTIGTLTLQNDPSGALKHLIKSAQFETPLKKSPFTYAYIAGAYETGPYAKQSDQYKEIYFGKDETPESKLALANVNQIVDRMIDGYARAVALAGTDPKYAEQKKLWLENLTSLYKYRNNDSDTGMNELIAGVLSKPLPPEPTPLTSLPTSPATSPVGNSGRPQTNGTGSAPTAEAKPAAAKPSTPDRPRHHR